MNGFVKAWERSARGPVGDVEAVNRTFTTENMEREQENLRELRASVVKTPIDASSAPRMCVCGRPTFQLLQQSLPGLA